MRIQKRRKIFLGAVFLLLVIGGGIGFFYQKPNSSHFSSAQKSIVVYDGKSELLFSGVMPQTVNAFLSESGLSLREGDSVFPKGDAKLTSGTRILITRARTFTLLVDGTAETFLTQAETVEEALKEKGIRLDEDDIVAPGREALVNDQLSVRVTRVEIAEESVEKPIAFQKKTSEDSELSWRKTIVTQKGEKGIDRLTYRVSRYDGKEVNRKLLKTERVKEPVDEVVTQGTYVKVGKSHRGGASWYAHTGTLAAANPWLPMGSYVKVTNTENGKSVIVVINDRGPFGAGRIIDLDKVAFEKIASLGTGVVNVKMEEIVN